MGKHIDRQVRVADGTRSETDLLKSRRRHKVQLVFTEWRKKNKQKKSEKILGVETKLVRESVG